MSKNDDLNDRLRRWHRDTGPAQFPQGSGRMTATKTRRPTTSPEAANEASTHPVAVVCKRCGFDTYSPTSFREHYQDDHPRAPASEVEAAIAKARG